MTISKSFFAKVIKLIELHILCCITFHRRADSFAEKDRQSLEIIAEWGRYGLGLSSATVLLVYQEGNEPCIITRFRSYKMKIVFDDSRFS